jgi:tetratricopeptide (TPR) repeat protein
MRRFSLIVFAAVPLLAAASAVLAVGQDNSDACGRRDIVGQISSCTPAIQGGGEPTQNPASADKTSGAAYYPEEDPIDGYTKMIRLELEDSQAQRGSVMKGRTISDSDRVIAHYDAAIMLNPKDDDAYFRRGIAYFYAGSVPHALADFSQASRLDPEYAYYVLWLDILNKRSNEVTFLPQAISQIDMTKWPAPVIRLFLGQTTPAAVLAAADDPDASTKSGQVCEANFYSGELALQRGVKEEAARLFRFAAANCPRDFVEGPAAYAELRVLGVSP